MQASATAATLLDLGFPLLPHSWPFPSQALFSEPLSLQHNAPRWGMEASTNFEGKAPLTEPPILPPSTALEHRVPDGPEPHRTVSRTWGRGVRS